MAKTDTMTIAFPNGGILPRDVTGGDEQSVGPHEPVEVPRAYGEHLVADRFAYLATSKPAKAHQSADAGQSSKAATSK